jgi:hypothetical protein
MHGNSIGLLTVTDKQALPIVRFQLDPHASGRHPADPVKNTLYPEHFPVAAEIEDPH